MDRNICVGHILYEYVHSKNRYMFVVFLTYLFFWNTPIYPSPWRILNLIKGFHEHLLFIVFLKNPSVEVCVYAELGTSLFEIAQSLFALERTLILGAMALINKKSEAQ